MRSSRRVSNRGSRSGAKRRLPPFLPTFGPPGKRCSATGPQRRRRMAESPLPGEGSLVGAAHARARDAADPLAPFRDRFYAPEPPGTLYLDGNSLGLLSKDAEEAVLAALEQWKRLAIGGWVGAEPAWFTLGEELGARMARLVGAEADEVVVTGTTTVNLHSLATTFYRPEGARRR